MGLHYPDLNPEVRAIMLEELSQDISNGTLYISPRLTPDGADRYPALAREAFSHGDDDSFAGDLSRSGAIKSHEERRKRSGGVTIAQVPVTAAQTLAEGEFNRFYMRALCVNVMRSAHGRLVVHRAKPVRDPRPESEAMIGRTVDARSLLADLKAPPGVDAARGLPGGPNSGLSLRIRGL